MRFYCGKSSAQRWRERWNKEREKHDAQSHWHKVFAWLPIRTDENVCVWLEQYERRLEWRICDYTYNYYIAKSERRLIAK